MDLNNILFQAGMVGAFILFTIILIRIESTDRTKNFESFKEFIQQRDQLMVDLLAQERDTRKEVMRDAIGSIEDLTEAIGKMDQRSTEQHQGLMLAIQKQASGD